MREGITFLGMAAAVKAFLGKVFTVLVIVSVIPAFFFLEGCRTISIKPERNARVSVRTFIATGYDNGPKSCGWKRNWLGQPVYAYGPNKGKPKAVGITASGRRAKKGTIAADTRYYPFGTVMYVPGYGYGRVEDTGGAIKGADRIDLWFPSENEALNWGKRKISVKVWIPEKKRQK